MDSFGGPKFGNFFGGFGVPKFGNFFGGFWGSEIRKRLRVVFGFQNLETSLGSFGVPKFGSVFVWFCGSEIRKRLWWTVLGFQNSKVSFGADGGNSSKNEVLIISEL